MRRIKESFERNMLKQLGFAAGFVIFLAILWMPEQQGLPVVGQRLLAILAFAVMLWMTEAIPYSVSALFIMALIVLSLSTAPDIETGVGIYTSKAALRVGLNGFSSSAVALVGAALVIALSMSKTGLDKRIALKILSLVGTDTRHILIGTMVIGSILAFIVPSATARVSCLIPILLGIIHSFNIPIQSRFSGMLMITATQMASLWNIGVATASSQNFVALGYVESEFGTTIGWLEWFIAGAPFVLVASVAIYFIVLYFLPPEQKKLPGSSEMLKNNYKALGRMKMGERKLTITTILLLFFWITQGILHPFDTVSCTLVALAYILFPKIGILTWPEVQKELAWGTLILFGVGIGLGNALLETGAAAWLAHKMVDFFNIPSLSSFMMIAILSLFLIVIHLGFASSTALAASILPIMISIFTLPEMDVNPIGMLLIMQFVISFGFILPVNAPQNMLVYGTGAFHIRDFIKIGAMITLACYILILLFSETYWQWLGLVT